MTEDNWLTKQTISFPIPLVGKSDVKVGGNLGKTWSSHFATCIPVSDTGPCTARVWRSSPPGSNGSLATVQVLPSSTTHRSKLIVDLIVLAAPDCDFWNEARDGYRIHHAIFVLNAEGKDRRKRQMKEQLVHLLPQRQQHLF